MLRTLALLTTAGLIAAVPLALADPGARGAACSGCSDHAEWPTINGSFRKARNGKSTTYKGTSRILGGAGNDAISAHHGRGTIDCGPGRDIYHVPKSLKKAYKVRNCEKVDRRSERQRGGGLQPLG